MIGGWVRGIGVDLIELSRIQAAHRRWGELFLGRIYAEEELRYCLLRANPYPSLAVRWAAKEAVAKAFGVGFGRKLSFRSIAIHSFGAAPQVRLSGQALDLLEELGGGELLVSLSHTSRYAIAQATLVGPVPR
jgi:holo-[acyl-carrier protein] synthase